MNWRTAVKVARREAVLKEKLAGSRVEIFYLAQGEDGYCPDSDYHYMMGVLESWADQYELDGEIDQANKLRELATEGMDDGNYTNQVVKSLEKDYIRDLASKTDSAGNTTRANQLWALANRIQYNEYDQWDHSNRIINFFQKEVDFYKELTKKYDDLLGITEPKKNHNSQQYLAIYHNQYGWAQNWYL